MNKLGHFEENLLAELREVVAARAGRPRPGHAGGSPSPPRVWSPPGSWSASRR